MFLDSYHNNPVSRRQNEAVGSIRLNSEYYTARKPVWLVALKLCGLAAMIAVAVAIAWPSLRQGFAPLQCAGLIAGALCLYSGLAFFVRPEPNPDNMGFVGGLANDPTQYGDNINRSLWSMHCWLGPGRFAAETLLDCCVLMGIASGEEVIDDAESPAAVWNDAESVPRFETTTMRADRFE